MRLAFRLDRGSRISISRWKRANASNSSIKESAMVPKDSIPIAKGSELSPVGSTRKRSRTIFRGSS